MQTIKRNTMHSIKNHLLAIFAVAALFYLTACQQPGTNSTGSEYMPDMGHSVAYEANVFTYYNLNTWDSASVVKLKDMSIPRVPVNGTVPRGYAGVSIAMDSGNPLEVMAMMKGQTEGSVATPINGSVPYYYEDTEDERTRAIAEIIDNPFPITADGLERGKELYNIMCGICHGEKGDGAGYLVREPDPAKGDAGGVYPVVPANFLLDEHVNSSNGRYYHAIMYGKNVMGAYKDKLSYEERWQVIHYIRTLQAAEKGLAYNEEENTLNPDYGVPGASLPQMAMADKPAEETHHEGEEHHEEDAHGEKGSHSGDEDHSENGGH
jgi:mono/diheme cytochrome c family protein